MTRPAQIYFISMALFAVFYALAVPVLDLLCGMVALGAAGVMLYKAKNRYRI
ncbi:hypothetical protein [Lewinella sp. W8]|uniref:hypothetical protein n=1 Tax=Lewinella sp. W8 TaxID=2528208 RepID=UPI0012B619BC|nr:hypothetical protein [Lewinella sp. W8]MTB53081.1 hypothetical protein [Lewinella sp. W8]